MLVQRQGERLGGKAEDILSGKPEEIKYFTVLLNLTCISAVAGAVEGAVVGEAGTCMQALLFIIYDTLICKESKEGVFTPILWMRKLSQRKME